MRYAVQMEKEKLDDIRKRIAGDERRYRGMKYMDPEAEQLKQPREFYDREVPITRNTQFMLK